MSDRKLDLWIAEHWLGWEKFDIEEKHLKYVDECQHDQKHGYRVGYEYNRDFGWTFENRMPKFTDDLDYLEILLEESGERRLDVTLHIAPNVDNYFGVSVMLAPEEGTGCKEVSRECPSLQEIPYCLCLAIYEAKTGQEWKVKA